MKRSILNFLIGFLALSLLIAGFTFWRNSSSLESTDEISTVQNTENLDADYAVYSALIKKMIIRDNSSSGAINISDIAPFIDEDSIVVDESKTFTLEEQIKEMKERFSLADESTLRDFIVKQNPPLKLKRKFDLPSQYNLVNEKRIKDNGGLASKGVISFSRVGFNKDKTQAFVVMNYYCPTCGFMSYFLLEKQNNVWIVQKEDVGLIS